MQSRLRIELRTEQAWIWVSRQVQLPTEVYIANVLKCRPPGNRDPQPDEIEACESHLFRQVELIEPAVVATLGNFATKLLSGKPAGITRVHGVEQETTLGGNRVTLYPLYQVRRPAARAILRTRPPRAVPPHIQTPPPATQSAHHQRVEWRDRQSL